MYCIPDKNSGLADYRSQALRCHTQFWAWLGENRGRIRAIGADAARTTDAGGKMNSRQQTTKTKKATSEDVAFSLYFGGL